MQVDITQLALTAGIFIGQRLLSSGTDKILDTLFKKLLDAIHARFPDENRLIKDLEKDPNNERLKTELIDSLSKEIGADEGFRRQIADLVQELLQRGWVMPSLPPPTALHQLPADISDFIGRKKEVADLLKEAEKVGTAPKILAVTGMAGTGKSRLAIHAAHLLKSQFPSIQLYVNLNGADPQPTSPLDVLAGFLRALGHKESDIPKELEDLAAKYRSALSNRKAIILLDNARDEVQVRPLLPGSPGCVVLITSRWSLGALDGVTLRQELKTMAEDDALALLVQCAGEDRVSAELVAAKRIVHLCGYLPLAIRIAGGHLKTRPKTLQEYASNLEDERQRLGILQSAEKDVQASFMMSYQNLSPREARMFRFLGLLIGKSFTPKAALALDGGEQKDVWKVLDGLVDAQLIEPVGTRYRIHDLVHLLARECLRQEEPKEQFSIRLRLARWYTEETREMNEWLQPDKRAKKLEQVAGRGEQIDRSGENEILNALNWFELERKDLLAAVEWAHSNGEWELTWQLATNTAGFYNLRGHWTEWQQTHLLALEAARIKSDESAEGVILNLLGNVYRLQGKWEEAASFFTQALELNRRLGNATGESIALNLLANVYRLQGRWDEAIETFKDGLEINRRSKNRFGEGIALGGLGNVYRMQGKWEDALRVYNESLEISKEQDNQYGLSITLNNIGLVLQRQGQLKRAEDILNESLSLCVKHGFRRGEGIAHRTIGEVYIKQRRWEEAFDQLTKGLNIAEVMNDLRCKTQVHNCLGEWCTRRGRWVEADQHFAKACEILRSMKNLHDEGVVLKNKGWLMFAQNKHKEADMLWLEALEKLNLSSPEYKEVKKYLMKPAFIKKITSLISKVLRP